MDRLAVAALADLVFVFEVFGDTSVGSAGIIDEFFGLLTRFALPMSGLVFRKLLPIFPIPGIRRPILLPYQICLSILISLATIIYRVLIIFRQYSLG